MNSALRPYVVAGVALVGAGVIAGSPVAAPPAGVRVPDIQLTAGEQGAQDIVIDFVRHAQTSPDGSVIAGASNGLPGFPLSQLGEKQAGETADLLYKDLGGPNGVAGIFGGYEQRMAETAAPFDKLEGMTMQPLYGFNEISGGICTDAVPSSPCNTLSELSLAAWAFGLRLVPAIGSNAYNGEVFEDQANNAISTAYSDAIANPVVSANGHVTDVVFSGGAMIAAWTLMNVNNPDVAIFIPLLIQTLSAGNENGFLANAGITEVEGNPEDGWTLISFSGQAMPEYPGLLSDLIVDVRNLITPPQTAAYNLFEAAISGVSTTIGGDPVEITFTSVADALEAGAKNVGTAIVQFPGAVVDSIAEAAQKLAADVAGGESFSDAFGQVILGLAP